MTNLHPQVIELLAPMSANPPAQPWEVSISEFRTAGEKLVRLAGEPDTRCDVTNLQIPLSKRVLEARAYHPRGARAPVPGVVYFHGGGFVRGGLNSHDRLCREICVLGGLSVISVAYRLAPENRYPDAHDDAIESFLWVADNVDELGINGEALGIAGDSAGGLLVAAAASKLNARADGAAVKAQGLLCPVLDPTLSSDSASRYASAPLLSRAALEWCVDQYVPDVSLRASAEVSPLFSPDLRHAPPAVIVSAEVDPASGDARRYASLLESAGVSVVQREYQGMPHSFFLLAGTVDDGQLAIAAFAEALSKSLR